MSIVITAVYALHLQVFLSYTDNMTYELNPDIRLINTLKRNGTLKLSPSDELHASRKAFKGSTKGKDANSDEFFYEQVSFFECSNE